ncbi:mitosis inhibitor protein kinase swe1 [Stemphylium lycopersici]|uniref:Kinase-like protein n=1 Tax=Stemphylium lycopersici TaxID=183478 RepID=A0A364NGA7_STELY|nr:mitosis inhibitor protein kinase swe1 [Stemphylium lycopersici]RAR16292.1 kinase-like protein [Stemphylium lycopersici]
MPVHVALPRNFWNFADDVSFISAPHSRSALRITRKMLAFLFSYHQVIPCFLDFVFPFGKQVYMEDAYFSGFREESRIARPGKPIHALDRSGFDLRICYNLRSVERSESEPVLKWSIRQAAVYHEFDAKTGRALWVVVKANKAIQERVKEASALPPLSQMQTRSEAFSASLVPHLLLTEWAGENWRWYINALEDELFNRTRDVLSKPADRAPSPLSSPIEPPMSPQSRKTSFPMVPRSGTDATARPPRVYTDLSPPRKDSGFSRWGAQSRSQTLAASSTSTAKYDIPEEVPPVFVDDERNTSQEPHSFRDLQQIQYIEEKAQESLLVLNQNTEVLEELKQYYADMVQHPSFPSDLRTECSSELVRFNRAIEGVEKDLRMLRSRTETLVHLLGNRKDLLSGMLHYSSAKASESSARKAEASAKCMTALTQDMHEIAQKTKRETVSMRVITSVTLFFLPATFIATFMSTDILNFEHGKQNLYIDGLKVYLAVAIPLTAVTFLACAISVVSDSDSSITTFDRLIQDMLNLTAFLHGGIRPGHFPCSFTCGLIRTPPQPFLPPLDPTAPVLGGAVHHIPSGTGGASLLHDHQHRCLFISKVPMPGSENEVGRVLDHIINHLPVSNHKAQKFIPRYSLKGYLTREKIEKILNIYAIDILKSGTIEKSYLAVFAILLRIDEATSIPSFIRRNDLSDTHLPFRNSDHWPDPCKRFFAKFSRLQWEFCVEDFAPDRLDDKELDDQSILPILTQKPLKEGPDSWTYKIQIHPDYNSLTPVLYHQNEVHAYKLLSRHNDIAKHIAHFHGSWKQGDWYNLLLEYVEGNTLEEMFKEEHPTSEDDMLKFWTNCVGIFNPLLRIHYLGDPSNPQELAIGAHQDIKPANILVESSRSTSTFDRTFKLADLGAPECYRDEGDLVEQRTGRPLDPLKDVWSLACTLSETTVWCVLGPKGLREYRARRAAATRKIPAISQTAYDGCFHDGEKVLDVVQQVHNEVRKGRSAYDKIINEVLPIIENMLNLEPRPDIRTVRGQFKRALEIAEAMTVPSIFVPQPAPYRPLPAQTPQSTYVGLGLGDVSPLHHRISRVITNGGQSISEGFEGGSITSRVSEMSNTEVATPPSPAKNAHITRRATHSGYHSSRSLLRGQSSARPLDLHTISGISSALPTSIRWEIDHANSRRPSSASMESGEGVEYPHQVPNTPVTTFQQQRKEDSRQHVTMDQVLLWSRDSQNISCPVPEEYLNNIRGTDQIFVIDTSASMEQYRKQIRETFEGLAYLVKKLDMDGIDLHLTTSREKRHGKNRKPMLDLLSTVHYGGETYMKIALGKVWERSNKKGFRNLMKRENNWGKSIYVFTDGKWKGDDDTLCGVPELVKGIVDKMDTPKLGIQFIQFGNDPVGSRRLQELDEGLKEHGVTITSRRDSQLRPTQNRRTPDHHVP